jgi:hypothetical protein
MSAEGSPSRKVIWRAFTGHTPERLLGPFATRPPRMERQRAGGRCPGVHQRRGSPSSPRCDEGSIVSTNSSRMNVWGSSSGSASSPRNVSRSLRLGRSAPPSSIPVLGPIAASEISSSFWASEGSASSPRARQARQEPCRPRSIFGRLGPQSESTAAIARPPAVSSRQRWLLACHSAFEQSERLGSVPTSKRVAKKASRGLKSPKVSKAQKSIDASALAQAKPKAKPATKPKTAKPKAKPAANRKPKPASKAKPAAKAKARPKRK